MVNLTRAPLPGGIEYSLFNNEFLFEDEFPDMLFRLATEAP